MNGYDLSIRLDHYRQFPTPQVEDLAREFVSNFFATSLVRYMVWYHLYLFHVDYQTKQSVCETLQIPIEKQTKILAAPKKSKLHVKRTNKKEQRKRKKRERRAKGR